MSAFRDTTPFKSKPPSQQRTAAKASSVGSAGHDSKASPPSSSFTSDHLRKRNEQLDSSNKVLAAKNHAIAKKLSLVERNYCDARRTIKDLRKENSHLKHTMAMMRAAPENEAVSKAASKDKESQTIDRGSALWDGSRASGRQAIDQQHLNDKTELPSTPWPRNSAFSPSPPTFPPPLETAPRASKLRCRVKADEEDALLAKNSSRTAVDTATTANENFSSPGGSEAGSATGESPSSFISVVSPRTPPWLGLAAGAAADEKEGLCHTPLPPTATSYYNQRPSETESPPIFRLTKASVVNRAGSGRTSGNGGGGDRGLPIFVDRAPFGATRATPSATLSTSQAASQGGRNTHSDRCGSSQTRLGSRDSSFVKVCFVFGLCTRGGWRLTFLCLLFNAGNRPQALSLPSAPSPRETRFREFSAPRISDGGHRKPVRWRL